MGNGFAAKCFPAATIAAPSARAGHELHSRVSCSVRFRAADTFALSAARFKTFEATGVPTADSHASRVHFAFEFRAIKATKASHSHSARIKSENLSFASVSLMLRLRKHHCEVHTIRRLRCNSRDERTLRSLPIVMSPILFVWRR